MSGSLLIDLDGVVRTWDPRAVAHLEERYDLPTGSIAVAAFGDVQSLREAVTGRITDAEWRLGIAGRLSSVCGASAPSVVAEWSSPAGTVDADVLTTLRLARRAGWRIGLLTNATSRLETDLARLGLEDEFDAVINSADLGVAKPDVAVFERACAQFGVLPGQCLFVDDSVLNVEGALEAGLDAHVFRGAAWLAEMLGVPRRTG